MELFFGFLERVAAMMWLFLIVYYALTVWLTLTSIKKLLTPLVSELDVKLLRMLVLGMTAVSVVLFAIGIFKHYIYNDWTVYSIWITPAWILVIGSLLTTVVMGLLFKHSMLRQQTVARRLRSSTDGGVQNTSRISLDSY